MYLHWKIDLLVASHHVGVCSMNVFIKYCVHFIETSVWKCEYYCCAVLHISHEFTSHIWKMVSTQNFVPKVRRGSGGYKIQSGWLYILFGKSCIWCGLVRIIVLLLVTWFVALFSSHAKPQVMVWTRCIIKENAGPDVKAWNIKRVIFVNQLSVDWPASFSLRNFLASAGCWNRCQYFLWQIILVSHICKFLTKKLWRNVNFSMQYCALLWLPSG